MLTTLTFLVAAATTYAGHGAESVSAETLARFAPTPLPEAITAPIQAMLDVRSAGAGVVPDDGKALYFTWKVTGVSQIWRLDGPQRFPVQMTGGEDTTGVQALTNDGKYLVVSRDRRGEENPGLYLQPVAGGPLELVQRTDKVQTELQGLSDDGQYLYFRANDRKPESYAIYRYDLKSRQRELVYGEDGSWSLSDSRDDGHYLLSKAVGSNMAEFYELFAGKLTPLFGQGEREDYQAVYGAAGDIIVLTPKLGEFRRLYTFRTGKLAPLSPETPHDVSGFEVDHAHTRVSYEVNENGYTRWHALDLKTGKAIALPAFPNADHVRTAYSSHNGRFTSLVVESSATLPQTTVYDWKTHKLTAWQTTSAPEIDLSRFGKATLEGYPARDGTKIPMFVYRPASCTKPCPVIASFHGGPESQATPIFSPMIHVMLDAGFIVVQPNVRGSDGYGRAWVHADDGPKRAHVITDIEDCAKFVRSAWGTTKVGIFGGSYGGYSSLIGMTMFAGAFDAGVEIVGISNLVTFLENTAPYRRALRISEYGDPVADRDALLKLSPSTYVDRVKGPLLMIQGASDPRVPVGEAIQIYNQLAAKKLAAKLVIFADEGHGAQKRENIVQQTGQTLLFFQQHLLGQQAASQPAPHTASPQATH